MTVVSALEGLSINGLNTVIVHSQSTSTQPTRLQQMFPRLVPQLPFNPFTLRVPLEIIVCYSNTFENNLELKRNFTKYLERELLINITPSNVFQKQLLQVQYFQICQAVLAGLSVNGLTHLCSHWPKDAFQSSVIFYRRKHSWEKIKRCINQRTTH